MTNPSGNFGIRANPAASASVHDDGLVILDMRNGRMFTSNLTGALIWRGIERQLPVEAIADEISGAYHVARKNALEDTARFLTELERSDLIEREARS